MNSIVKELAGWTKANIAMLSSHGVRLTEKFPAPNSACSWKVSVTMSYKATAVSFTVWERTVFQTELIVMNANTGKTLVMDEKTPATPIVIRGDLDLVVQRLLSGFYDHANPDPKLIIS